jgi:archaellum component FlaC
MRFFKYLVFLFSIFISIDTFAFNVTLYYREPAVPYNEASNDPVSVCKSVAAYYGQEYDTYDYLCRTKSGGNSDQWSLSTINKDVQCPPKNTMNVHWMSKSTTSIPLRMCVEGCTYEGSGLVTETQNYKNTILFATGDTQNCTNLNSDSPPPKCDTKDPYGECYVPPNDDCVRLKDGSITCPKNNPPPTPKDPCNGETYCKKPPTGCGSGYVSGSFNGQELCVKSGPSTPPVKPNDPNDPENPNKCATSYCPKPDDNKDCPSGYYQTTHNGESICVKNNPTPNNPNPNDPNNSAGGDNGSGSSEPSTGDGSGTGGTGKIDLKPVIDAIKALKDALLSALDSISKKMTSLIDGQKKTNETLEKSDKHLENIEKSSQAASDVLGESNEHLKKIEEATQATSEALGQTNSKLDSIKDSIDGSYKCKNESYNPNDKFSQKYRDCTEEDIKNGLGEQPEMPFKELELGQINTSLFKVTGQCPAPYQLYLPVVNHTFPIDISKLCDVLSIIGLFIALAAMIHGISILVENS